MRAFVAEWGVFGLLLSLGWLLQVVVVRAYAIVKQRLDRSLPDDLPMGAGPWLETEIERRKLDAKVLVSPTDETNIDAFLPQANAIILSQETFVKRDASFWAIAAHELGHFLTYRRSRLVHFVLTGSRLASNACVRAGVFLLVANVLYASPGVTAIAFALVIAGLAFDVVVLVDEAIASIVGLRLLPDAIIGANGRSAANVALFAAFLTYAAAFAGSLLLVLQRPIIEAQLAGHRHFVVAANALGNGRFVLAIVLSLLLAVLSVRAMAGALRARAPVSTLKDAKRLDGGRVLAEGGRGLVALGFVALVWDQALGPLFPIAVAFALLGSRTALAMLVHWPRKIAVWIIVIAFLIVLFPVLVIVAMLRKKKAKSGPASESERPARLPPEGASRAAGEIEAFQVQLYNAPPIEQRIGWIATALAHVAFVIAFWVLVISS